MAQVGLGVFTKKSTKMVLIGSNHRLEMGRRRLCGHKCFFFFLDRTSTTSFHFPCSLPFFQFATNEAIQRTEAYEYAQSLGSQPCSLPNFQVRTFLNFFPHPELPLCVVLNRKICNPSPALFRNVPFIKITHRQRWLEPCLFSL